MTNEQAARVLARYPASLGTGPLLPLGNRGGFSGARLWRAGAWCLRAWPVTGPTRVQLEEIHGWLDAARLPFLPAVARADAGASCLEHAGKLWDLTAWLPGVTDFHTRPTVARLQAACQALATLHRVWGQLGRAGAAPAVQRRLVLIRDWPALAARARPVATLPEPLRGWAERAGRLVARQLPGLAPRLLPWRERTLYVQPCLADIWHDHVLFEGDRVTGLVDHGSVRIDQVAADLARLLGSLARDDAALRQAGLDAYTKVRPLSLEEEQLVPVLDQTGTVLGLVNWLRWLLVEQRTYENVGGVAQRLAELVARVESWEK